MNSPAQRRVIISATVSSGGIHAHLRNVVPRYLALRPQWRFEVHGPESVLKAIFGRADEPWMRPKQGGGRGARLRWEFVELPRLLRADREALLLAPSGPMWNLRLARRAVVKFDNLLVLLDPAERVISKSDAVRVRILRHLYLATAKRALRPVCASYHSRARYVALTGLPEKRFAVVSHGIDADEIARAVPSPAIDAVCRQPFVVNIGQATPYRCTRELIQAYRILAERDPVGLPPLVWAGKARIEDRAYELECLALLEPLVQAKLAQHVGQIGYQDVYALDRSTRLFVYPSLHEDCPNTLFEAMAAGAPVLCSDIPAHREFGGDAVHFLPACTPEAMASAIGELLADPRRREALGAMGRIRSKRLNWDDTARGMVDVMEEAFAARE